MAGKKGEKGNKSAISANTICRGGLMKKYPDMYALFNSDAEAKRYYDALPAYVKEQIGTRAGSVNSLASLQDYAENLLRGDG